MEDSYEITISASSRVVLSDALTTAAALLRSLPPTESQPCSVNLEMHGHGWDIRVEQARNAIAKAKGEAS